MEVTWNCCHNTFPAHTPGTSPFQKPGSSRIWNWGLPHLHLASFCTPPELQATRLPGPAPWSLPALPSESLGVTAWLRCSPPPSAGHAC